MLSQKLLIHTITTNVGQIEYSTIGSGEPVVFIHGGHSNCRETLWHTGFNLNTYRLITPTRPGYGNTPLAGFHTPRQTANLILSLLKELKILPAIIIGISAGGLTAVAIAAHHPEIVKKLVLLSAVTKRWLQPHEFLYRSGKLLFSPATEKLTWALFRKGFDLFPKLMAKVLFKQLSLAAYQGITDDEIQWLRSMVSQQGSGDGFVNDLEQELPPEDLKLVQCPTLIIHSENDKSVKMDMALHANQNIPHSTLVTYENYWGHLLWLGEGSKVVIERAIRFIQY